MIPKLFPAFKVQVAYAPPFMFVNVSTVWPFSEKVTDTWAGEPLWLLMTIVAV